MIVFLGIVLGLFIYLSVGLILNKVFAKKMARVQTTYSDVYNEEDEVHYKEKDVYTSYGEVSIYMMLFGWPIYFFALQAQLIAKDTYRSEDEGVRKEEKKYLTDQAQKNLRQLERLNAQMMKQLNQHVQEDEDRAEPSSLDLPDVTGTLSIRANNKSEPTTLQLLLKDAKCSCGALASTTLYDQNGEVFNRISYNHNCPASRLDNDTEICTCAINGVKCAACQRDQEITGEHQAGDIANCGCPKCWP